MEWVGRSRGGDAGVLESVDQPHNHSGQAL